MYVVLKVQNQDGSQSGYRFFIVFSIEILIIYSLCGLSLSQENVKINKNNF